MGANLQTYPHKKDYFPYYKTIRRPKYGRRIIIMIVFCQLEFYIDVVKVVCISADNRNVYLLITCIYRYRKAI